MNYFCHPFRIEENRDKIDDPFIKDVLKLIEYLEVFIYFPESRWPFLMLTEIFRVALLPENSNRDLLEIYEEVSSNWEFEDYQKLQNYSYYLLKILNKANSIILESAELREVGRAPLLNFLYINLNNRRNTKWRIVGTY